MTLSSKFVLIEQMVSEKKIFMGIWEIHIKIFLAGTCELLNWNQTLIK
jgi:hypothetical protein